MTLGASNIKMSQIMNEWAGSTRPLQFSLFRRHYGGLNSSYCPGNYETITTLPASGNLRGSDFFNTNAESSAQTMINGYWPWQVQKYWRATTVSGGQARITSEPYAINNPVSRYNGSWTTIYQFEGSDIDTTDRAWSKYATSLQFAIGAQSNITTWAMNEGSWVFTGYNNKWREQTLQVRGSRTLHRAITGGNVTYTRLGNNSGAWDAQLILPSLWVVENWVPQPVTAASYSGSANFTYSLPAGKILVFTNYTTGYDSNFNSLHPVTPPAGVGTIRYSAWWYNSCAIQIYFNGTSTAQNITWANAWQTTPDPKSGAGVGTPQYFFAANDGTNGHQVYILGRNASLDL